MDINAEECDLVVVPCTVPV